MPELFFDKEIKNCPFCGGKATLMQVCNSEKLPNDFPDYKYVVCECCGTHSTFFLTADPAVYFWNIRVNENNLEVDKNGK